MNKRLTVNEAADYLGITRLTLYKWRKKGYGPPWITLGWRLYYPGPDLEAWFRAQHHGGRNA